MVAVGGRTPDLLGEFESKDPWPQGLGVFDLTKMEWLDTYDAGADLYTTPKVIKDGISKNGSYPRTWDDADTPMWLTGKCVYRVLLGEFFDLLTLAIAAAELLSANSSSGTGTGAGTGNPGNNSTDDSSNRKGLSTGVLIAIVIGSIIGILVILYLLGRRFKWPILGMRRRQRQQPAFDRWEKPELENTTTIKHKRQEMDGAPVVRYEMVGSDPAELPGEYIHQHGRSWNSSEVNHATRTS